MDSQLQVNFLACTNPQVIEQHDAKVYGKEPPGTPPMTVPHLDARYIDGQEHCYLDHSLTLDLNS